MLILLLYISSGLFMYNKQDSRDDDKNFLAQSIDKQITFKKTSIPNFTWNWLQVENFGKINDIQDCGIMCSSSNDAFNSLVYDSASFTCSLTYVRIFIIKFILLTRSTQ